MENSFWMMFMRFGIVDVGATLLQTCYFRSRTERDHSRVSDSPLMIMGAAGSSSTTTVWISGQEDEYISRKPRKSISRSRTAVG